MAQKLIVEIAGDTSKLEHAFKSAGATADGLGSRLALLDTADVIDQPRAG